MNNFQKFALARSIGKGIAGMGRGLGAVGATGAGIYGLYRGVRAMQQVAPNPGTIGRLPGLIKEKNDDLTNIMNGPGMPKATPVAP